MKKTILWIITILLAVPLPAQPGKDLHSLLNELAVLNHTAIAFSPTLISGVYPKNTDLTGALDVVLKRILKGTQFDFRVVHGKYYQVYMKPKPPKVIVPEPAPEPKPERVKMGAPLVEGPEKDNASIMYETRIPPKPCPPPPVEESKQLFAVKSNLLYDVTATLNFGFELALGEKTSFDVSINCNPWTFSDSRRMRLWIAQPEFRKWKSARFEKSFWGAHLSYGIYDAGGVLAGNLKSHRYQGIAIGAGVSYGYRWNLGESFAVEAELGAGYVYLNYEKYARPQSEDKLRSDNSSYLGPTKLAFNLIYAF